MLREQVHKANNTAQLHCLYICKTIMLSHILFAASTALLLASANAEGLYSKGSAVLQVNGKSYDKLIAKSNQVSVILSAVSLIFSEH